MSPVRLGPLPAPQDSRLGLPAHVAPRELRAVGAPVGALSRCPLQVRAVPQWAPVGDGENERLAALPAFCHPARHSQLRRGWR